MTKKNPKWAFTTAEEIRSDIRETYIKCIRNVLNECPDPKKIAVLEGMMRFCDALLPFTEEPQDENIQND